MDLNEAVVYRGFDFNNVQVVESGVLAGCEVKRASYGNLEILGYTEKRSLEDGYDASDVFLGRRTVTLEGNLFGYNRGDLYDRLRNMRFAINPRMAFDDEPGAQGYQPLYFSEPTELGDAFGTGLNLMMRVRSTSGVRCTFDKDEVGGTSGSPLAIRWQVAFEAKDPRVYLQERRDIFISGSSGGLDLLNRGGHPARLNLILVLQPAANIRVFTFSGAGTAFDLTIPVMPNPVTVRFDSEAKVVTVQEQDAEEKVAMDYLDPPIKEWPELVVGDNHIDWSIHRTDGTPATTMSDTSLFWYREAFS
jgi:hypothetical protein